MSVKVRMVSLICTQNFTAVTSHSRTVTLQFSFYWHKPGVMAVAASSLFLLTDAMLSFAVTPPAGMQAFATPSCHFLLRCPYWL